MILLVSHQGDDHLAPVLAELGRIGSESVVVDTSQIPSTMALSAVAIVSNTRDPPVVVWPFN